MTSFTSYIASSQSPRAIAKVPAVPMLQPKQKSAQLKSDFLALPDTNAHEGRTTESSLNHSRSASRLFPSASPRHNESPFSNCHITTALPSPAMESYNPDPEINSSRSRPAEASFYTPISRNVYMPSRVSDYRTALSYVIKQNCRNNGRASSLGFLSAASYGGKNFSADRTPEQLGSIYTDVEG